MFEHCLPEGIAIREDAAGQPDTRRPPPPSSVYMWEEEDTVAMEDVETDPWVLYGEASRGRP
eukprot:10526607-Heterocapsa_arctica.AAC.1